MVASDISFPWYTSPLLILAVFAASLLICHFVFIFWKPLGSITWKHVDYIWLAVAGVGILVLVGSGRVILAKNMLAIERDRFESARNYIEVNAKTGTGGAVCRQFVRSEFSPPPEEFEKVQRQFDRQCAWFHNAEKVAKNLSKKPAQINVKEVFGPYPSGGEQFFYQSLVKSVNDFNIESKNVTTLEDEAKASAFDDLYRILAPGFFIFALALRMTKVTAEIRAERKKK